MPHSSAVCSRMVRRRQRPASLFAVRLCIKTPRWSRWCCRRPELRAWPHASRENRRVLAVVLADDQEAGRIETLGNAFDAVLFHAHSPAASVTGSGLEKPPDLLRVPRRNSCRRLPQAPRGRLRAWPSRQRAAERSLPIRAGNSVWLTLMPMPAITALPSNCAMIPAHFRAVDRAHRWASADRDRKPRGLRRLHPAAASPSASIITGSGCAMRRTMDTYRPALLRNARSGRGVRCRAVCSSATTAVPC